MSALECPVVEVAGRFYRAQHLSAVSPLKKRGGRALEQSPDTDVSLCPPEDAHVYGDLPAASAHEATVASHVHHASSVSRPLPRATLPPAASTPAAAPFPASKADSRPSTTNSGGANQPKGDLLEECVSCDTQVFGFVIGRAGATKKRIENESGGASLTLPSQSSASATRGGKIIVRAPTHAVLAAAVAFTRRTIATAVAGGKLEPTHFISIPLTHPALVKQVEDARDAILKAPWAASCAIDSSVFPDPRRLHLTVVVLRLYSDEARAQAAQLLESLQAALYSLLDSQALKVTLAGLGTFQADPAVMNELHLEARDSSVMAAGGLLPVAAACAHVVERFVAAGLALQQDVRPLVLHATFINSRYRQAATAAQVQAAGGAAGAASAAAAAATSGRPSTAAAAAAAVRQPGPAPSAYSAPFDGRQVLQLYGAMDFGTHVLAELHLSDRTGEDTASGYYHCAAAVMLPRATGGWQEPIASVHKFVAG